MTNTLKDYLYDKHCITLRYIDKGTEQSYLASVQFIKNFQFQYISLLTIMLYLLYLYLDYYTQTIKIFTYALYFYSSIIFMLILTISLIKTKYRNFAKVILYLAIAVAITASTTLANLGAVSHLTDIYIIMIWVFLIIGLQLHEALIISVVIFLTQILTLIVFDIHSDEIIMTHTFFLFASFTLGLLGGYMLELYARVTFDTRTKLKNETTNFNMAQEISHTAMWEFNATQKRLTWSNELYNILGLKKDAFSLNTINFLECIHPDDRERFNNNFISSIKEHREYRTTHKILRPDGDIRYLEEIGTHSYDINGKYIKTVGMSLDITEKYEIETILKEINKNLDMRIKEEVEKNRQKDQALLAKSRMAQMGELLSLIAHQWKQPLSSISSTISAMELSIILEEFDLNSKEGQKNHSEFFLERVNKIRTFVETLSDTIDDFRNFYNPNKRSSEKTFEEVVMMSLTIMEASLIDNKIELSFDYQSKEKIWMYDGEMMQVVLNFLKNAQDNFIEKKIKEPIITITTKEKSISICDNGGGIKDELIEKIFDPYFSTKDEAHGTGLGLHMSKTIVEDHHGGQLIVQNKGKGACFIIDLSYSKVHDQS